MVAKWFPQVIVSFWAMVALYARERNRRRPYPFPHQFEDALRDSLVTLKARGGLRTTEIFGKDGKEVVRITADDLERMIADPDAPFK
jgi:hypothetical protein